MAELLFQQFEAVVREAVNPEIERQYEEAHTLFNKFTKGKAIDITPKGYKIPFYDRPPASDAFMGQTSAFPVPDNPNFSDMKVFHARYATSFRINGDVFDSIGGDALIDNISDIFLMQTEAAKKTLDFQVAGSRSGVIAVVKTATTGANGTITLAATVTDGSTFGSYKIKDGARLNVINGSTNAVRGAVATVVDPGGNNRATNVVTLDQVPAGTTANDYITYEGSALNAPMGLTDLINNDSGEIQGQLRSRHPHLKSVVVNASGQRLNVALLVEIHYSLRYRTEDMSSVTILSSPTARAGYASNGYNLVRFNDNPGVYKNDFKDVAFGGADNWEDHVSIDPDRTYGVHMKYIDVYQLT